MASDHTILARSTIAVAWRESGRVASELLANPRPRGSDDPAHLALCRELHSLLRQLWQNRAAREEEWAEVVTYLQVNLTLDSIPSLTARNVEAVAEVLAILGLDHVGVEDARRARDVLVAGGLDPWRGISADGAARR